MRRVVATDEGCPPQRSRAGGGRGPPEEGRESDFARIAPWPLAYLSHVLLLPLVQDV
jgi:hypothetical protein